MYSHDTQLRTRYSETDQMGYVYYGNYPAYYECGRVEAMRALGLSYAKLEESGVMMPVLESYSKYHKPGKYDEQLTIRTHIPQLPTARMRFEYEIFNEGQELIHSGWTMLTFVNMETGRPMRAPAVMREALAPYFDEK
ncbi:MAG TPA: thioesterase [Cytophagales bacterium]|nr:thioesterase [Cytophagales bacterium]HAA21002.1 thioesterase [Cytophagales bacterium]HAP61534.1 thioesterase [Cytophagales bacterium]